MGGDVRFSRDGRPILSHDYLTVKIWDVNKERSLIKTTPVREYCTSEHDCAMRTRTTASYDYLISWIGISYADIPHPWKACNRSGAGHDRGRTMLGVHIPIMTANSILKSPLHTP
ncbi:uncharacterized protein CC84DRAFT_1169305 [Paraphaeosphaeria sporulosa]|uniref:Uncharacterized protein n=1 Tax=Paraphaeosphaeria sporulosa TaxID=1460663 RepID=A0A177BZE7_9PLEO|nr:uncharacterized protein CC84DRAFT_1169305 [Paraphaeosphaeria sporulosa]OAF99816.1 hypothetical protein CC84DRAFT_1169305 [Paraphaeosphaeria sporulosa]